MPVQFLCASVRAYAERIALVSGTRRLSYQELYQQVIGLSQGLRSAGVHPAAKIAFVLPNCPEFIIAFYAIALLEAVAVPLNPLFKAEELHYYMEESETTFLITDRKHFPLCSVIAAQARRTIKIITIDGREREAYYFYDLIEQSSSPEESGNAPGESEVLYQYSSGSTGRPKRVSKTQHNLMAEADNFYTTVKITPDDAILCLVPLFHTYGFGNCVLAPVRAGARLVLLEPVMQNETIMEVPLASRVERIMELLAQEKVSLLPAVPYIYQLLADAQLAALPDVTSLRLCFSAGNFLPAQTFDKFFARYGIAIRQQYGCTEAGAITVHLEDPVDPAVAGKALQNTEVVIMSEDGPLPAGEIGEVVIKSPAVVRAYYQQPELNAVAFQNGYYYTGDLGKIDHEGRLTLTGRKKIFIDTGGYKVDPAEIEDVLLTHPQVLEVAVVGIKAEDHDEAIKAVIVSREPRQADEIIAYCKSRLADFKVPRSIEFRAELPRSPLGKLLRKDLLEPLPAKTLSAPSFRARLLATHTAEHRCELLEIELEQLLAQMLQVSAEEIDAQRPLGEYGLNSVSILELRDRLQALLSMPLAPSLFWNYPTVKALAGYLCTILAMEVR